MIDGFFNYPDDGIIYDKQKIANHINYDDLMDDMLFKLDEDKLVQEVTSELNIQTECNVVIGDHIRNDLKRKVTANNKN